MPHLGGMSYGAPQVYELILNFGAVSTTIWIASRFIGQDGSKCKVVAVKLLHTLELILEPGVTTTSFITSGDDGVASTEPQSKGSLRCS